MYVYMAISSIIIGIALVFVELLICAHYNISILKNLWLLAIPTVLAITINIVLIEIVKKVHKK